MTFEMLLALWNERNNIDGYMDPSMLPPIEEGDGAVIRLPAYDTGMGLAQGATIYIKSEDEWDLYLDHGDSMTFTDIKALLDYFEEHSPIEGKGSNDD